MEELELDITSYSTAMENALAFMYWSAKIDANDVEFVLAPPTGGEHPQFDSAILGPHSLWVLDFDCCRDLSMDADGINKAAVAFLRNDPFYPRPGKDDAHDARLWDNFKVTFIEASTKVIGPDTSDRSLPRLLMDRIEELARKGLDFGTGGPKSPAPSNSIIIYS